MRVDLQRSNEGRCHCQCIILNDEIVDYEGHAIYEMSQTKSILFGDLACFDESGSPADSGVKQKIIAGHSNNYSCSL